MQSTMARSWCTHINGMTEQGLWKSWETCYLQLTGKSASGSYMIEKSMLAIRKVQLWACVLDSNRLRADTVFQLDQQWHGAYGASLSRFDFELMRHEPISSSSLDTWYRTERNYPIYYFFLVHLAAWPDLLPNSQPGHLSGCLLVAW